MKKVASFSLFISFIIINAFSQSMSDKDMEKEIKLSKKYYYGESISINDSIGKQAAREELMAYIAREYKLFNEGDIIANGIKYLSFPRGDKVRTISYVLRSDVSNTSKKQDDLKINEIKYSDKTNPKSNNDSITKPINKPNVETNNISENNINIDLSPNDKFIITLINISSFDELLKKLDDQKYKGKLIYGKESAFESNKENCYIIILNTDLKTETILGKGGSKRFDFKNNRYSTNYKEEYLNTNEIWLFFIN